jgi:ferrochelatase
MIERTRDAFQQIPAERHSRTALLFTAHSIPMAMAGNCSYEAQLRESARLIAQGVGHPQHQIVYQSRSGPPSQPWLEPDVGDVLRQIAAAGEMTDVVAVPVGFISDHIEVLYHPRFVTMIRELIEERIQGGPKLALGEFGPSHDVCPVDCCRYEPRRPTP